MKLHEYQAKALLAKYGVPVPRGEVASSLDEVRRIAKSYQGKCVVKVQIHAGGRGKSGGVKLVDTLDSAVAEAEKMLSGNIVTSQTTSDGVPVNELLIEEALDVIKELYLSILVDGGLGRVIVMASEAGGMEIEQVAEDTPEQILREVIDPNIGLMAYQARNLAIGLGLDRALHSQFIKLLSGAFNAFIQTDCSLIEINPLAVTAQGRLLAIDAKASIDDDALFRQKNELLDYDSRQEPEIEMLARTSGLSYVKLDGDVGCLVNGAGLAMATMDVIMAAGATPANFLDVGGGADVDKVHKAVDILLSDPGVKKVFVNIFGGILRCDVVAEGIVAASKARKSSTPPIVARMLGTNADEGRKILKEAKIGVHLVNDFTEATKTIKSLS
ncbi:MAG: ADP-forming succinate--CoA ligase subunit beta [Dehalococcoidia bacterium]|nr:ADP-forming succinate--CoA ligase subunit beta [Dehalococcoidia bacterium]